jgi:hypothetical protein
MRYRFQPWQLAALLILICVGLVVALYYVRQDRTPAVRELAAWLPAGPGTLVYIDVAALRDSGILETLVGSRLTEHNEYKRFVEDTGFDYKVDLDQLLVKFSGEDRFFVVGGRFDWKKLITYAERTSGGDCRNGFCRVSSSLPNRHISFYPLRRNLMALASAPDQWAAYNIKRQDQPASAPVPAEPVWISLPGTAIQALSRIPEGTRVIARALEPAENVLLTLGPAEQRFLLSLDVTCKTAEEAAILKAQLEGVTAMLQKMIARENQKPNPTDLSGVLTAGTFERRDRHVLGRWPIEVAFINSIAGS